MDNFHDVCFPDFLARSSSSSIHFLTQISESISGNEFRKIERDIPLRKYLIKHTTCTREEYLELVSFFKARRGSGYSFRFKDYFDYKVENQIISVKDSFITKKMYQDEVLPTERINIFPIQNTIKLEYLNQIQQFFKTALNQFELEAPHTEAQNMLISFEFDVIVRFHQDEIKYSLDKNGAILIEELELIEVIL